MIKMLAPALRHPTNRDPDEFRRYWEQSHGPLFSNTRRLRRYVQHITMGELAGDDEIRCTHDGCSMFWYDGLDSSAISPASRSTFLSGKQPCETIGSSSTARRNGRHTIDS